MLAFAVASATEAADSSGIAHQRQPVDLQVLVSPEPVRTDGSLEFVYELHVTNFTPMEISAHLLFEYRGSGIDWSGARASSGCQSGHPPHPTYASETLPRSWDQKPVAHSC